MNTWQALRQIKSVLEAATWPDGTSDLVFGDVVVSAGFSQDSRPSVQFPLCRIRPLGETPDDEAAGLVVAQLELELTQQVHGDHTGEVGLLGGSRSGGQGSSDGRGLLELEEQLKDALGSLGRAQGINLRFDHASSAAAGEVEGFGYLVFRVYEFSAWLTEARTYAPVRNLTAIDLGSGNANLLWTIPPTRYDSLELVIRRAAGSTAPATVADGDAVSSTGLPSSAIDPGLSTGTYSYSVFVGYDETGAGSPDRYSAAASVTVAIA